ncbi:MAG: hypothetical protein LBR41_00830 [Rickettsiales bacterium]|nr:hypothetical protein [Rickettsiales bacterium]
MKKFLFLVCICFCAGAFAPAFSADRNISASIESAQNRAATVQSGPSVASRAAARSDAPSRSQNISVRAASATAGVTGDINDNPAVRRAGVSLRPTAVDAGGRPTIAGTNRYVSSNFNPGRGVSNRGRAATDEVLATNAAAMDATEACRVQYMDCMDQFCNVVDANQKRCSCSPRLSGYQRVESGVKDANNDLNEVAQMIRYVGLTADEIRSIMNATEAELALDGQTDNTDAREQLSMIENLIRDPAQTTVATTNTVTTLDLNLDFSAEADSWSDMFSLDSGQQSFSQMRGQQLFRAAAARCKIVLNNCQQAGANTATVTARYDMEIDKDCIGYEKGLDKMNQTLRTNVRAATSMLQKARLEVLNNQNSLDARGCMAALDTCMADDMVCGKDYTKCLDPTKKYIDENGNVVLGENIAKVSEFTEDYEGDVNMNASGCSGEDLTNGNCIIAYLLDKIGVDTKSGLCRAVMDKCRRVTYDETGHYIQDNIVVKNYLSRAMVNIRAGQAKIVSDYASSCISEIGTCYSAQVTQVASWSASANPSSIQAVMNGACRNVALTCAYAVFANDDTKCDGEAECIENVSTMFYQSMLCPDGAEYRAGGETGTVSDGRIYVNDSCLCPAGMAVTGNRCVACPANSAFNLSSKQIIDGITGCACSESAGYYINGIKPTPDTTTYGSCKLVQE